MFLILNTFFQLTIGLKISSKSNGLVIIVGVLETIIELSLLYTNPKSITCDLDQDGVKSKGAMSAFY